MSIMIQQETKVIVQGITGSAGAFHTQQMLDYGTQVVGGVTPGKGGQKVHGLSVFDTVKEAKEALDPDISILFVPAPFVKGAAVEALKDNLHAVIITEGVPVNDTLEIIQLAQEQNRWVLGPNCPGLIVPEEIKIGIMPSHIFKKGKIGLVSRSGTLTYEIADHLTKQGLGQSTVVGIGGDPIPGLDFIEVLEKFENDPETEKIVVIGEIGGDAEEKAAAYIKENVTKPVVAYITGTTAPKSKTMGHAGAIVSGNTGLAETKIATFEEIGVLVAALPSEIPALLKKV
ncbi:MAG: succinate--CoA ligase subunit alpha [Patescibacteria group bacterium]|nr:succinate--CoA ligase subunit alpha [Patescibacteria group bacterium]